MQNPPAPARAGEGNSEFVAQVTHELSELRVMQDASDRRTQATLSGLHQSMEKLVAQLAALEPAGHAEAPPADTRPVPVAEVTRADRIPAGAPSVRLDPPAAVRPRQADADPVPSSADPLDSLIEPGAGRSGRAKGKAPTPELDPAPAAQAEGPASFIAAARRAAQAAQASAAEAQKPANRVKMPADPPVPRHSPPFNERGTIFPSAAAPCCWASQPWYCCSARSRRPR